MLSESNETKIVDFGFAIPSAGNSGTGVTHSYKGTPGYMAPEIINGQAYQPNVVDLFALGVILFVMRSCGIPFKQAKTIDRHYRKLIEHDSDGFWRDHEQGKAAGYYSLEFKDLVTSLLRYQPAQRVSMADVIGHPWVASVDCATTEEINAEFAQRKHQVDNYYREEEESKQ